MATIHGDLRSGDQRLPTNTYVENGTYVDVYSCTARSDGSAQVDLKSSDFESFVIVGTEDSGGTIHTITTNNSGGSGRNAHVDFNVSQDARYFVAATTTDGAGRTGSYELDFSGNLKDVTEETGITPAIRAAAAHRPIGAVSGWGSQRCAVQARLRSRYTRNEYSPANLYSGSTYFSIT